MDRFALKPVPVDAEPATNEHRLSVPECLLLRRHVAMEFREDALARLVGAVPDLAAVGTKGAIRRMPTEPDLAGLRAVAEWYGFPFDAKVRTDEEFTRERRLWSAHRRGRWER